MKCLACERVNRDRAGFCAWCGAMIDEPVLVQEASQGGLPLISDEDVGSEARSSEEEDELVHPFAQEPGLADRTSEEGVDVSASAEAEPQSEQASADKGPETSSSHPLKPDELLADRYRMVEQTVGLPERNEYRAQDLVHCSACGFGQNSIEDEYCQECGAAREASYVTIVENLRHVPEHYEDYFVLGEREYFVTSRETAEEQPSSTQAPLRLTWGCRTDPGQHHDQNEDAIDLRVYSRIGGGKLGLFAIADGLGGQDSGEVASQMALDSLWRESRERVWEPLLRGASLDEEEVETALRDAIAVANADVYQARIERSSEMSTTLTVVMIVDDVAYIGNVGDSRTYLWNTSGLQKLTKDHSLVQRLVDSGRIQPEDVYTHPERNVIYQSVGDRADVQVDTIRHKLMPDDRLVLCSDGLWEMVRTEGLEDMLLAEIDPQRASDQLVQNANLAGGEDNISVIIVQARA